MASGLKRRLEYADLQVPPDDGRRYELARGALFVTPSPTPDHQRISKRLQRQLEAYFETRGVGEVFDAPVDVLLTNEDVSSPIRSSSPNRATCPGAASRRRLCSWSRSCRRPRATATAA